MGVVLGSAVVPIAMCITWKKANRWGCIGGAIAGFCIGVVAWLVTTSALNGGSLTVTVRQHSGAETDNDNAYGSARLLAVTSRCLLATSPRSVLEGS